MFAFSTWCFFTLPLISVLKFMRNRGIQVIELWCSECHLDPFMTPVGAVQRVVKLIKDLDLEVRSLHLPSEIRVHDLDEVVRFLDELSTLDSLQYVVLHPQKNLEVMRRLSEQLHERGLQVLLENSVELSGLNELLNVVKLCGVDGICLDVGHALIHYGVVCISEVLKFTNSIKALHLHDNDSILDLHLMIGSGVLPQDTLRKLISKFDPENVVTEVYYGYYGDDPNILVDLVKEFYRNSTQ